METKCACNKDTIQSESGKTEYILTVIGVIIFVFAMIFQNIPEYMAVLLFVLSYLLIGYEIFFNAIKRLFKKDMFDENFLMTIATVGAFCIGEYVEGIAVLLLYRIGEFLQDKAVENSKKKIQSALAMKPEYANLKVKNEIQKVNPSSVKIDDVIIVKNGEKVPLDGVVIEGNSQLDMSALNGESLPKDIHENDTILSGAINIGSVLAIKVTKTYETSTIAQIIDLIQNATNKKSKTEKFITKFAKIYTPIVILLAIIILITLPLAFQVAWTDAFARVLNFLVISCPCALVISVPLGFFMGIGAGSKEGILVKGSNYLDILSRVKTVVFDKTGTLTKGKFGITKIVTKSEMKEEEILAYIAMCETYSNHYIAKSILDSYDQPIDKKRIATHEEIAGKGIKAVIDNQEVLCGNESLLLSNQITFDIEKEGTVIYLAVNHQYAGCVVLADEIKENSENLVSNLKKKGIQKCIMLTGDSANIADEISSQLLIDETYSKLLPQEKVSTLESIQLKQNQGEMLAYVGDGINDSPVIAMADVGIAMGKGSDIAIETSDVVLMTDDPLKLVDAITISKKTLYIVKQNIVFALFIKILFLVLSALGLVNMWWAIFADVGVTLLTIVNSLRIYHTKY